MKTMLVVLSCMAIVGSAAAQSLEELRAELFAVEAQIAAREAARVEAAQVEALRRADEAARAAHNAAVSALPEVKQQDQRIAALRTALRDAVRQREAAIETNRAALAEKQSAAEQASAAYREAAGNGRLLRRLALRREQLQKQIAAAEGKTP